MKILITSGGTTEKIDDVRGITNHSTGYLGKEIAELFLAKGCLLYTSGISLNDFDEIIGSFQFGVGIRQFHGV